MTGSTKKQIGIIVGSLRKESFSRKIGKALIDMSPEGFDFRLVPLDDLPVYNQDFDDYDQVPESYERFRQEIRNLDGVIFITPEYNRSIPGVLKNALDVGSRPRGKNVWSGKPAAVISSSTGNLAAFGAHHHLRQCLVTLNVPAMQQPEVYVSKVTELFDEQGALKEGSTKEFLQKAVDAYVIWFNKLIA